MVVRAVPLALAVALAGCAAGEIAPIAQPESGVELGTGEAEFQPLDDDAVLEVVLGVQGGYHVVGNAHIFGYVPPPVLGGGGDNIHFQVLAYDGIPLNIDSGAIQTGLKEEPDGTFTCSPGHHVLVGAQRDELDGTPAEFTVEMVGEDGEMMTDSRRVVLQFAE